MPDMHHGTIQQQTPGACLDEYLMSKQLYALNEESLNTTFRNGRGDSNINLTIITNQLLRTVTQWEISDQESSSKPAKPKF